MVAWGATKISAAYSACATLSGARRGRSWGPRLGQNLCVCGGRNCVGLWTVWDEEGCRGLHRRKRVVENCSLSRPEPNGASSPTLHKDPPLKVQITHTHTHTHTHDPDPPPPPF